MPYEFLGTS